MFGKDMHSKWIDTVKENKTPNHSMNKHAVIKPKDLVGIPWRVAFALQAEGWYLRKDVIWNKPNPMPESCTDRPTSAHEYIFLLTKSKKYFWDGEAVKEPVAAATVERAKYQWCSNGNKASQYQNINGLNRQQAYAEVVDLENGRNLRSVWEADSNQLLQFLAFCTEQGVDLSAVTEAWFAGQDEMKAVWQIATQPFGEAHFATFPPELARRCILAGSSEKGCCRECGAPWERVVEKTSKTKKVRGAGASVIGQVYGAVGSTSVLKTGEIVEKATTGWQPTCDCNAGPPVPCIVLDPFGGAGTVGVVCKELKRDYLLLELSREYAEMAQRRIETTVKVKGKLKTEKKAEGQLVLF